MRGAQPWRTICGAGAQWSQGRRRGRPFHARRNSRRLLARVRVIDWHEWNGVALEHTGARGGMRQCKRHESGCAGRMPSRRPP